ncbi:hypothetical protein AAG570_000303 [Ranatra chinensis]|uniref:Uncharacterized protein n=1 Tax=Ranatra chinensis TaxID=642074 RepID=A0ABD0YWN0_9HEMI
MHSPKKCHSGADAVEDIWAEDVPLDNINLQPAPGIPFGALGTGLTPKSKVDYIHKRLSDKYGFKDVPGRVEQAERRPCHGLSVLLGQPPLRFGEKRSSTPGSGGQPVDVFLDSLADQWPPSEDESSGESEADQCDTGEVEPPKKPRRKLSIMERFHESMRVLLYDDTRHRDRFLRLAQYDDVETHGQNVQLETLRAEKGYIHERYAMRATEAAHKMVTAERISRLRTVKDMTEDIIRKRIDEGETELEARQEAMREADKYRRSLPSAYSNFYPELPEIEVVGYVGSTSGVGEPCEVLGAWFISLQFFPVGFSWITPSRGQARQRSPQPPVFCGVLEGSEKKEHVGTVTSGLPPHRCEREGRREKENYLGKVVASLRRRSIGAMPPGPFSCPRAETPRIHSFIKSLRNAGNVGQGGTRGVDLNLVRLFNIFGVGAEVTIHTTDAFLGPQKGDRPSGW